MPGGEVMDPGVLAQVLTALAQGAGGQAGQRAWTALAGMTARICGRDNAETRAVEAARTGTGPDPAGIADLAARLARQAGHDPAFAAALEPWLSAVQILLADSTALNQVTGPVS